MIPDAAAPAVTTQAARGAGIVGALRPTAAPALIGRRPDLDGLRGLAIALVLLEHTAVDGGRYLLPFTPAMIGVTVFFVLSGYLITGLLMQEASIDLRNFYLRRVARLGPALAVLLVFVTGYGIATSSNWIPGVASSLLYVNNWAHIAGLETGYAQHTWTLAIEEQFYLLWPLAMIVTPRRWLLPIAIALATVGCALYAAQIGPVFYSTFTNGGAIMAGCAAALAALRLPRLVGLVGIALIAAGAIVWSQGLTVVGAVLVVVAPVDALLPIGWLGRRAYSLYLWSWPLMFLLGGPAAILPTFAVAELSYRLVERPILARWHERLRPRVRPSAPGRAPTGPPIAHPGSISGSAAPAASLGPRPR